MLAELFPQDTIERLAIAKDRRIGISLVAFAVTPT